MTQIYQETVVMNDVKDFKPIEVKPEPESDFPSKEVVDKLHFKAVARQKFDAVLKHEINNRRASSEANSEGHAGGGTSQCFRIENSRIFSIKSIPQKPSGFMNSLMLVPKMTLNSGVENTKSHLNSRSNKDGEGQVFIYDPILISADSLNYMSAEGLKINSASNKKEYYKTNKGIEKNSETYSEAVFRCYLCPYFHVKEMMIARHWVQTHLTHNVYECPYCDAAFLTNFLAARHVADTHPNEEVMTKIKRSGQFAVGLSFDKKNSNGLKGVEAPPVDEKDKGTFPNVSVKCHKCSLECKSIADLEDHHRHVHIHFRPYSCGLCNSRICFATRVDLDHHVKITHPNSVREAGGSVDDRRAASRGKEADFYIDWSQACTIGEKGKTLTCKWCHFQTSSTREMCQHALKVHHWSRYINCPKCNSSLEMKDDYYRKGKVTCSCCAALVNINHDMNGSNALISTTTMYKCVPCDYRTASKGSICRHLKYNHSKCRPFCCPYCEYSAVERPKVRSHILSLHPGMETQPTEKLDRSAAFKKSCEELFRRFVRTEKVEFFKNAFSGELKVRGQKPQNSQNRGFFYECSACKFTADNIADARNHVRLCNRNGSPKFEVKEQNPSLIFGEHFKCISCNYKCHDRSCMARHVKYKHLTSRPHQCPHCPYNNVEKTKVRLHIGSNHPNMHNHVTTNHHLLEQMSVEAKKFYVRVDAKGGHCNDSAGGYFTEEFIKEFDADDDSSLCDDPGDVVKVVFVNEDESVKTAEEIVKASDESATPMAQVRDASAAVEEDSAATIDEAAEGSADDLSNSGFSGSLEDDEFIDLNDDVTMSSGEEEEEDEDVPFDDPSRERDGGKGKRLPDAACFDGLVVEPSVLLDPKISRKVPIVRLKDFVIDDEEAVESLVKESV